jgi:hypothetical protein
MATPTAEDRFKYNLLAERINELGAILVAACRADPGFLSWPVREELEGAAAFLTGGQLDRTTVRPMSFPKIISARSDDAIRTELAWQ